MAITPAMAIAPAMTTVSAIASVPVTPIALSGGTTVGGSTGRARNIYRGSERRVRHDVDHAGHRYRGGLAGLPCHGI